MEHGALRGRRRDEEHMEHGQHWSRKRTSGSPSTTSRNVRFARSHSGFVGERGAAPCSAVCAAPRSAGQAEPRSRFQWSGGFSSHTAQPSASGTFASIRQFVVIVPHVFFSCRQPPATAERFTFGGLEPGKVKNLREANFWSEKYISSRSFASKMWMDSPRQKSKFGEDQWVILPPHLWRRIKQYCSKIQRTGPPRL